MGSSETSVYMWNTWHLVSDDGSFLKYVPYARMVHCTKTVKGNKIYILINTDIYIFLKSLYNGMF
jgi:hypothetical protein